MKFFEILKSLEQESREYSSNGWYQRSLRPRFELMCSGAQDRKLTDFFLPLPNVEDGERDLVQVRSLVEWQPADIRAVELAFQISLPGWVHDFYSKITCAILCFRNPIIILPPADIITYERTSRSFCDPSIPVRMITFAEAGIEGSVFAFRQSTRTDEWEIALSSLEDSLELEQSAQYDEWVQCDRDLDDWIERMVTTDGHPLMKGRSAEICYTERWK